MADSSSGRLWIDLGEVKELAEVIVNRRSLGVLWKAPWRVDITDAVHPGANELQVNVTNLWVNRLIGDQQPDTKVKVAFTTFNTYRPDSTLMPSGLLGPVMLLHSER